MPVSELAVHGAVQKPWSRTPIISPENGPFGVRLCPETEPRKQWQVQMTIASRGGICQREVCLSEDGTVFLIDPSHLIPTVGLGLSLTRCGTRVTQTLWALMPFVQLSPEIQRLHTQLPQMDVVYKIPRKCLLFVLPLISMTIIRDLGSPLAG